MTEDVDEKRRHFLTMATVVTGGVGIAFAAVPFLGSLKPSARALALGAPVEVPVGMLEAGEMVRVMWRGRVVYVLKWFASCGAAGLSMSCAAIRPCCRA
jgi:ubiquinol-cytochrome c reductase iron-sulfur subunit